MICHITSCHATCSHAIYQKAITAAAKPVDKQKRGVQSNHISRHHEARISVWEWQQQMTQNVES
jgi:hypothetical protein